MQNMKFIRSGESDGTVNTNQDFVIAQFISQVTYFQAAENLWTGRDRHIFSDTWKLKYPDQTVTLGNADPVSLMFSHVL